MDVGEGCDGTLGFYGPLSATKVGEVWPDISATRLPQDTFPISAAMARFVMSAFELVRRQVLTPDEGRSSPPLSRGVRGVILI